MRDFRRIMVALVVAAVGYAQPPVGDGKKIEILPASNFYDDHLSIQSGQVWWVLFSTPGEGVRLRYAPLNVERFDSGFMRVFADGFTQEETVLLFRGTKELPRGPVVTTFCGDLTFVPNFCVQLGIPTGAGGNDFCIEVEPQTPKISDANQPDGPGYLAYIVKGKKKQLLCKWNWKLKLPAEIDELHESIPPRLRWAGDLDRDDRLDLLVDMPSHSLSRSQALFLSSYATRDEVVHKVAEFDVAIGD